MRPLLFVNWAAVSARFTALMWALVLVLMCVVIVHLLPSAATSGGAARAVAHAAGSLSSGR